MLRSNPKVTQELNKQTIEKLNKINEFIKQNKKPSYDLQSYVPKPPLKPSTEPIKQLIPDTIKALPKENVGYQPSQGFNKALTTAYDTIGNLTLGVYPTLSNLYEPTKQMNEKIKQLKGENVQQSLANLNKLTPEQQDSEIKKAYDENPVLMKTLASVNALLKGLPFGETAQRKTVDTPIEQKITNYATEKSPVLDFVSSTAGGLASTLGLNALFAPLKVVKGTGIGATALNNAVQAGLTQIPISATNYNTDKSVGENLQKIGLESLASFIGGGLLSGGFKTGKNVYENTIGFKKALEKTKQAIDEYKFPELNIPEIKVPERKLPTISPDIPAKYRQPVQTTTDADMPLGLPSPQGTYLRPMAGLGKTFTSKTIDVPDIMQFNQFSRKPVVNKNTIQQDFNVNDIPDDVDFWDYVTPSSTKVNKFVEGIDDRNFEDVGNRKIKSIQHERPELKPFIQQEASRLLTELSDTQKGQRSFAPFEWENWTSASQGINTSTKRTTSESIARILDNLPVKPTYNEVKIALEKIVKDGGAENNALSKRIELIIDDNLSNGTKTINDFPLPPSKTYLAYKTKQISNILPDNLNITKRIPIQKNITKKITPSITQKIENIQKLKNPYYIQPQFRQDNINLQNVNQTIPQELNATKTPSLNSILSPENIEGNINLRPEEQNVLNKATEPLGTNTPIQEPILGTQSQNVSENVQFVPENVQFTPKKDFTEIKTEAELPTTEKELADYVNTIQSKLDNGELTLLKVDLNLFGKAKEKLSKFATNTLLRQVDIDQDIIREIFDDIAKYPPEKVEQAKEIALDNVTNRLDETIERIKNAKSFTGLTEPIEAQLIAKMYEVEYKKTGDEKILTKLKNWLKSTREKTTETARALKGTDVAWKKNAPLKTVIDAEDAVENVIDTFKVSKGKKGKQLETDEEESKKLLKDIKNKTEKEIDSIVESLINQVNKTSKADKNLPEVILKNKIVSYINPKTKDEKSLVKEMINELFGEAKENIKGKTKIDTSIQRLANSYKYRELYGKVRQKAQQLLQEEFKNDAEALALLKNYFEKGFKPPHSEGLLNKVLNKRLSGLNKTKSPKPIEDTTMAKKNITEWVKDWYATGRYEKENFINALIKETGLTGETANSLKNLLDSRLKEVAKKEKDRLLSLAFADTKGKIVEKKTPIQKLSELVNLGMFENTKFVNKVSSKIQPAILKMLKDNNIKLKDVVVGTLAEQDNVRASILRNVLRNANVDDARINDLFKLIKNEFSSLTEKQRSKMLLDMTETKTKTKTNEMQNFINKINLGIYSDDVAVEVRDKILQKYDLPSLDNDDVKFIMDTMESIQEFDKMDKRYIEGYAKVMKRVMEKLPTSIINKEQAFRYIAMLLNPKSLLVNFGGNTLLAGLEVNPVSNGLRVAFDNYMFNSKDYTSGIRTGGRINPKEFSKGFKLGGRQTKRDFLGGQDFKDIGKQLTIKNVINEVKGKSVSEAFKAIAKSIYQDSKVISKTLANPLNTDITSVVMGDKFDMASSFAPTFKSQPLRVLENLTATGLKFGDLPFNEAYFQSELKSIMRANNVTEPTEDMLAIAFQVSAERTFKDNNIISAGLLTLRNLPTLAMQKINSNNPFLSDAKKELLRKTNYMLTPAQIAFNQQIPFAKTPGALLKRGIEYSPLGLFEGAIKKRLNKGIMTPLKQREIVDRYTRGTIGTGLYGLGALGYLAGNITGAKDEQKTVQDLKDQEGILSDALKVGDTTIDLKKLQPASSAPIAGARLAQGSPTDALKSILDSAGGAFSLYTDSGLLQNLSNVMRLLGSSEYDTQNKGKVILDNIASTVNQYNPALVKQISAVMDEYERNPVDENATKTLLNKIIKSVPEGRANLPVKTDLYGNPIKSYDGDNNILNAMVNPIKYAKIKGNPVSQEIINLTDKIKDTELRSKIVPKEVPDYINKIQLTKEQQNQYQKIRGDKFYNNALEVINNPSYAILEDEQKAKLIKEVLDQSLADAKVEMQQILNIDTKKLKEDAKEQQKIDKELYTKFGLIQPTETKKTTNKPNSRRLKTLSNNRK